MIAGNHVPVNTGSFTNDMSTFRSEDDVLTLLIHLGYLGYDSVSKSVFIPNSEVQSEYVNAVSVSDVLRFMEYYIAMEKVKERSKQKDFGAEEFETKRLWIRHFKKEDAESCYQGWGKDEK